MKMPFSVLIIDDEDAQLISIKGFLKRRGFKVFTATNGQAGYEIIKNNAVNIVLTDYRMPEWDGFTVLNNIKKLNPDIDIVIMTAYGSIEDAVEAMKSGAYDYLAKPIELDELLNIINRIQEKQHLIVENRVLKHLMQEKLLSDGIIFKSNMMEDVMNLVARVAPSKTTILVLGESGTGKELIAKAIHYSSPRRDRPFVVVNVAALSESLMESELFGHERDAFTGAAQQKIGRFEQANGGTLFIDEIGDIPLSVQVKLLRAIQFGQIERVGGNKTIDIDVRIVAATNQDIEKMVKNGQFREDLYYRINVVRINLPPLYRRKTDIPLLAERFIEKYAKENNKNIKGITPDALDQLMKHDYRGNVRELENIIERAVVLCRSEYITLKDLPFDIQIVPEREILNPYNINGGYEKKTKSFESELILEALRAAKGNKSAAARLLKISERRLRSRLEKLGLKDKANQL